MVAALLAVGAGDLQAQDIEHKLATGSAHPPGRATFGLPHAMLNSAGLLQSKPQSKEKFCKLLYEGC